MAVACLFRLLKSHPRTYDWCIRTVVVLTGAVVLAASGAPGSEGRRYILGPEDQFEIRAVEPQEIVNKPVRISADGMINLPLVGQVKAGGLTVAQLEAELDKRLAPFVNRPQVSVNVTELRSRRVSVMGAVNRPGVYQLSGERTLLEMLSEAGGLRADAGGRIRITRRESRPGSAVEEDGHGGVIEVRLQETTDLGSPAANPLIVPNDVILVTRAHMVYVVGEVQKPGGYVLQDRESLSALKALSLAGGLQATAAPASSRIIRAGEGSGTRNEMQVNLKKVLQGKSQDVEMQADDILFVPQSAGRRVAFRTMEAVLQTVTGLAIYRR